MYKIIMCRNVENNIARIRQRLVNGVTTRSELSSDSALRALSISMITRTDRLRVLAFTLPLVKQSQGLLVKSYPSKLLGWNPFHEGHSLQWESQCHETRVCPSPVSANRYQQIKIPTVANPTYIPITIYLNRTQPLIRESSDLLGGYYIILMSGGLNPRAVAGNPSVTRLTHSS